MASASDDRRLLSIVIPVFNERENLPVLLERIEACVTAADVDWELVLVDDGSTDGSTEWIRAAAAEDARVRYVLLSRNFGKHPALGAGLDHARGDLILLMDADLQDPPEAIPAFVDRIDEGYDIVFGTRTDRQDPFFKRVASRGFWRAISFLSGFEIPAEIAVMRIFNRRFLREFQRFPERQKFLEGIQMYVGLRRGYLPMAHGARHAGDSKFGLSSQVRLAVNAITTFSERPLTVSIAAGSLLSLLGLGFLAYIVTVKLLVGYFAQGWVSLFGIVLLVGGLNLLSLGVVGLYIGRLFNEVKARPVYIVDRTEVDDPLLPGRREDKRLVDSASGGS